MWKVQLVTRDGGLVGTVELPPFAVPPEVVCWGERFFKQTGPDTYTEVFCYFIPPQFEVK